MNRPDRFEMFVLGDGEFKVSYKDDTMMVNAGTFVVEKEDHTLGNLLRMQLLRDKRVLFAGYRCPHPLQAKFELKVRTDGVVTPTGALIAAINDLKYEFASLDDTFRRELDRQRLSYQL